MRFIPAFIHRMARLFRWAIMPLLVHSTASISQAGVEFPGPNPGLAKASFEGGNATLQNDVMAMTWSIRQEELAPATLANKITGERFSQDGSRLFRLGTKEPSKRPETTKHRVGIGLGSETVYVYAGKGDEPPQPLATFPRKKFPGDPTLMRIGKLDLKARPLDHGDPGAAGTCTVSNLAVSAGGAAVAEKTLAEGWTIRKSARAGTAVAIADHRFYIVAAANSAAAAERAAPPGAAEFFCDIDKETDAGMSWGPALALIWNDGRFILIGVRDGKAGVFNLTTPEGEQILAARATPYPSLDLASGTDFKLSGAVQVHPIEPQPKGIRVADRLAGQALEASLCDKETGLRILWRAELRDGSNYIRQTFTLKTAEESVPLYGVELVDARAPGVAAVGLCPGSPAAGRGCFFSLEMPGTRNLVLPTGVRMGVDCQLRVSREHPYAFSTVTGVYPEGQLRRGFLFYLERERARPSKPFLHYNAWYDFGYGVDEKGLLEAATQFHEELVLKRGVPVLSFLADDGWDDPGKGLWVENEKKFPAGFRGTQAKMARFGTHLGIWISPLGGYGGDRQRLAHARKMGLVPETSNFDLSYPKYKQWFQDRCVQLMREAGVNVFKWDRAGQGVSPHFMALLEIAHHLRTVNPDVFINVTVGTWPSPFWLNYVDTTWRTSGMDVGWAGKGRDPKNEKYDREKWLTYRDGHCHRAFVVQAPLYPLNSVMHHGIVHGRAFQGGAIGQSNPPDLKNEARSYFGNGAMLQELYLTPSLLTPEAWDRLAEAAKWAHAHAETLVDSHWVGGDPLKLDPYGYAAWSRQDAVLTLRNPSDQPQDIVLDAATAFELPAGAPRTYRLRAAYADQRVKSLTLDAGKPEKITLDPFEVLVFD